MEYKIGQVFEINGIWYQFVGDNNTGCGNCVFYQGKSECANPDKDVKCAKRIREDGRDGHFVRLLPIGDMYEQGGETWQQYKCVDKPNTEDKRVYISHTDSDIGLIISVRLTENDDLNLIERKIGEIFEHNGEWYQCIEKIDCENCAFNAIDCEEVDDIVGPCSSGLRRDGKSVIFKKFEKVGEPYNIGKKVFQRYEVFTKPYIFNDEFFTINTPVDDSFISIEIKQNEDMEENNNAKHSNSENIGKNLKAFDIEAAKAGKPVCTRDGRKARIICFDRKDIKPVVALVTVVNDTSVTEKALYYFEDGYHLSKNYDDINDLMMLPEKKEGWVNVSKFSTYASKEEALSHRTYDIINTIKVSWEE